jgi:hypothetical protein
MGNSLEDAVAAAHAKIPKREAREAVICRVLEFRYHRGGYVDNPEFYVLVCRQDDLPKATG